MSLSDAEDAAEEAETYEEMREAMKMFETAANKCKGHNDTKVFALHRAAHIAQKIGDSSNAESYLRRATKILPNDPRSQCELGLVLLNRGADLVEIERCFLASIRAAESCSEITNKEEDKSETVVISRSYSVVAHHQIALIYAQTRRDKMADIHARKLKFSWKLAPHVWQVDSKSAGTPLLSKATLPPACFVDDILPDKLFAHLARVIFAPNSVFWAEHGYPTDTFFSYYEPLQPVQSKKKDTIGRKGEPNILKFVVEQFVIPCVSRRFPGCTRDRLAGFEWWAHSRPNGRGHHMHYDTDEEGIRCTKIRHPAVSCVLTLSRGHGGSTLVCDHRLNDKGVADMFKQGWCLSPRENRLAFFDGSLLHGVLPRLRARGSVAATRSSSSCASVASTRSRRSKRRRVDNTVHSGAPRITLMIGLWAESPCSTSTGSSSSRGGRPLAPCMSIPKQNAMGLSWPALLRMNEDVGMCGDSKCLLATPQAGRVVRPVYVPVPPAEVEEHNEAEIPRGTLDAVALVGDFFLRTLQDTDNRIRMESEATTALGTTTALECEWGTVSSLS